MVGPSDNLTAVHLVIATNGPGKNPKVDKESRTNLNVDKQFATLKINSSTHKFWTILKN